MRKNMDRKEALKLLENSSNRLKVFKQLISKYNRNFTLGSEYSDKARLYAWIYNLTEKDFTCYCGNPITFNDSRFKLNKFCSSFCANHSTDKSITMKDTWKNRSKEEVVTITSKGLNKINSNSSVYRKKAEDTNIAKFGVKHAMQSPDILKKQRKTLLTNHGVDNPAKSESAKQKYLDRYGVDNPFSSRELVCKFRKNKWILQYPKFLKQLENKGYKYLGEESSYLDGRVLYLEYKCLHCNTKFFDTRNTQKIYCSKCFPQRGFRSSGERSVANYCSKYSKVVTNSRKVIPPLEVDIYIPEHSLAIEYHGLYWHNGEDYSKIHYEKYKLLEDKGIRLLQIFESEWNNKNTRLIIKAHIKALLGVHDKSKVTYGRKCEVKELNIIEYKKFLEKNHIQGYATAKFKLGLYFKNNLVAVLGIGKSRFKKDEIEVIRYCVKRGWKISGSLGKLIKYFCKNIAPSVQCSKIISYIDLRYFSGIGYINTGFKIESTSKPNYWYYHKDNILESRMKYQKHKLPNLLSNYNSSLTEKENMKNNGYSWIYDAGNLRLGYTLL